MALCARRLRNEFRRFDSDHEAKGLLHPERLRAEAEYRAFHGQPLVAGQGAPEREGHEVNQGVL